MSWLKIFKKLSFWSVIFSYSTWQWTISPLDCDVQQKVDFTWQPVMTSSVAGLRRSSKALPKAKLDQKLRLYSLVFCCPSDPLQLSESRWNCYIWEVCSSNQHNAPKTAMPAVTIVQQGPILHDNAWPHIEQPTLQKLNELGYKVLPHTHIHLTSRQPTATFLSISLTFCRENAFITSRRHKMLSKSSTPEAWIVMLQNKQMYLSLAKMYWLWWFIFWLIKVCLSLFIII